MVPIVAYYVRRHWRYGGSDGRSRGATDRGRVAVENIAAKVLAYGGDVDAACSELRADADSLAFSLQQRSAGRDDAMVLSALDIGGAVQSLAEETTALAKVK